MNCKHDRISIIRTAPFMGSVRTLDSGPAEHGYNPAAHGNITDTEKCLDCGATRLVNVNQGQREEGSWGESPAELLRRAAEEIAAVSPTTVSLSPGRRITFALDREACVTVTGAAHTEAEAAEALAKADAFLRQAQRARRLFLAATV